jgi:acetyl esterase/lipase
MSDRQGHGLHLSERARRRIRVGGLILIAIGVLVGIVVTTSPWPSALLIRSVFEQGGTATSAAMQEHVPDVALEETLGIQYSDGSAGDDTTLDVFRPDDATEPLPAVFWIHGGAWISGHKSDVDPYLRILAAEGYVTVGANYTVGPDAVYPTAVRQLNEALAYVDAHAEDLGIDPQRIVIAGDSAGSQLASQLATLTTNEFYADLVGIRPALDADQVVGAILNCGVYDLQAMAELNGISAWGFKIALWSYTGTQNWSDEAPGLTMSTIEFVTEDFPATYITGGNADGLTWVESVPMYNRLIELGVDVTGRFYPADHEPALGHEYQFELDLDEAQTALKDTIAFLGAVS